MSDQEVKRTEAMFPVFWYSNPLKSKSVKQGSARVAGMYTIIFKCSYPTRMHVFCIHLHVLDGYLICSMICKYNHALRQYGHPYPGEPLACTATSTAYVWTVRGPSGDSFQFWRGFVSFLWKVTCMHLRLSMTDACYGNLSISEKRWSTLKRCENLLFFDLFTLSTPEIYFWNDMQLITWYAVYFLFLWLWLWLWLWRRACIYV